MASGQHEEGSLVGDLASALESGEGADLTLEVGGTQLPAHGLLLSLRSPVIAAMLRHDTLEASSRCVEIRDMEEEMAHQLLCFVDTDQVPQLARLALQLLAASDRYDLPLLRRKCEQQLVEGLAKENAAAAVMLAFQHSCPRLKERAVQLIRAHPLEVMATDGWQDLCRHPETIAEVSRLVALPSSSQSCSENSVPATTGRRSTTRTRPRSHHSRTPATAALPTTSHHTPTPDDDAISSLRSLSEEEKNNRLMDAARSNEVQKLRMLLAVGADVKARDVCRRSALHWSVIHSREEAARILLQSGADVGARDHLQETPLYRAAGGGRVASVKLLKAASADPRARGNGGWSPLHLAAFYGHKVVATALLRAGANRGARSNGGATASDLATARNHLELVKILR